MAHVTRLKSQIETVGDLVKALSHFDPSLPIEVGMQDSCSVYLEKPQRGEQMEPRVCIEGGAPFDD